MTGGWNLRLTNRSYRSDKTSWLTSTLFYGYIKNLNKEIFKEGHNILPLDNFSGHKKHDKYSTNIFTTKFYLNYSPTKC